MIPLFQQERQDDAHAQCSHHAAENAQQRGDPAGDHGSEVALAGSKGQRSQNDDCGDETAQETDDLAAHHIGDVHLPGFTGFRVLVGNPVQGQVQRFEQLDLQDFQLLGTDMQTCVPARMGSVVHAGNDEPEMQIFQARHAAGIAHIVRIAPWMLYAIGAAIAVVLTFCKVPALPFALGMFIPIELNTPLLIGGFISWYVSSRSKSEKVNKDRNEKGTLIASGFIAGGALMGVVSALLRFFGVKFDYEGWWANSWSQVAALAAYLLLIIYFVWATKVKEKK